MVAKPIVFLDTETSGLMPHHEIIQLAAVAMQDDRELGRFEVKLDFNRVTADSQALEINKYSHEAWSDCVLPVAACRMFAEFLAPYKCIPKISKNGNEYRIAQLAGYNAHAFDVPRIIKLFQDNGVFFPASYRALDVMHLAMWYYEMNGNAPADMKLGTVCSAFGINVEGAHDAMADVLMTAKLARRLLGELSWNAAAMKA